MLVALISGMPAKTLITRSRTTTRRVFVHDRGWRTNTADFPAPVSKTRGRRTCRSIASSRTRRRGPALRQTIPVLSIRFSIGQCTVDAAMIDDFVPRVAQGMDPV